MSEDWINEQEFIEDVKRAGGKMTRRTARKWRQQRKIPFAKVNNLVMYPRDWLSHVKLIGPRHAS
jgi:hypothetical protein